MKLCIAQEVSITDSVRTLYIQLRVIRLALRNPLPKPEYERMANQERNVIQALYNLTAP